MKVAVCLSIIGLGAIVLSWLSHTPVSFAEDCDPSYPDVCIPSPPPDLDCGDITARNFRVIGADPHRFDGDHDGIGCEQ